MFNIQAPLLTNTNQLPYATQQTLGGTSSLDSVLGLANNIPMAGQLLGFAEGIIGKETIDATIGSVFANGMRLDCWGASRSPAKTKQELPAFLETLEGMAQSVALHNDPQSFEQGVNQFFVDFYNFRSKSRVWLQYGAKDCTRDGIKDELKGLDLHKAKIIQYFEALAKQKGYTMSKSTVSHKVSDETGTFNASQTVTVQLERYTVRAKATQNTQTMSPTASGMDADGNVNYNAQPTKAGMSPLLILAIAGLFLMKKKR